MSYLRVYLINDAGVFIVSDSLEMDDCFIAPQRTTILEFLRDNNDDI